MQAGQTVTHYKLQKRLGAGGMGEVWLADDTRLDQRVAIKFISPLLGQDREAQERFQREARAAAKLRSHPNVVPVYELGETEGSTFIVMDYVQGKSLREMVELEGATTPLLETLRWAKEIADGLSAAHAEGITHRDIKPDNVLLDSKRQVRIADFGLARLASSTQLTQTGAGMGTLKYMSPEQATGKNVDHRTDLFSLGATLYELLAGVPAFRGDDPPALVYAVAHSEPEPLGKYRDDLPLPLVELVETLLQKSPSERPQTAEVVSRELGRMMAALSGGEPAPSLTLDAPSVDATIPIPDSGIMPATPPAPPIPWWQSRIFRVGAVVSLVVFLAWGVVQFVYREPSPDKPSVVLEDGDRRLAILPFEFSGDPGLAHYAEDMVTMLVFVLTGTGDFTKMHPDSVIPHIETNRYITGTVRTIGTGIQVDTQLRDKDSTILLEVGDRANEEAGFQALGDRIGIRLIAGLFDQPTDEFRLAALNDNAHTEALKALLRGIAAHFDGKHDESIAFYQEAIEMDSTYALALYRASRQLYWNTESLIDARELAERANRHRGGLPRKFQLILEGWYEEILGNIDRSEQLYRSALRLDGNSPEANIMLGELMWDHNAVRGRSPTECIPFYERIFLEYPRYPGLFTVLRFAYFLENDMEAFDRAVRLVFGKEPNKFWQYAMACASDSLERQETLAEEINLRELGPVGRIYINVIISCPPDNHRTMLAHYERYPDTLLTPLEHLLNNITRGYVEAGLGRWQVAEDWFDQTAPEYALHVAEHRAMIMAVPILEIPEAEIRAAIDQLRSWPKSDRGVVFRMEDDHLSFTRFHPHFELHDHIRAYLLALLHARLGEFETALSYSQELASIPHHRDWVLPVENLKTGTAATIAYLKGDYQAALDHLDALENKTVQEKYALFTNRSWEIFLRGLILSRMDRGEEALPWFQQQPNEFGFALVAPAHLERARIYDDLGDTEKAVEYYTRFIDLWRDADPPLQPQVEEARERLAALSS